MTERQGGQQPREGRLGSRRGPEQPPVYEVAVEKHSEAGDHVEYCIRVTHRSGLRWRVWRRFSAFQKLHAELLTTLGGEAQRLLPPPPQKSWLPSFTQAILEDFCEQRKREMQAYLDVVLSDAALSRLEPLQEVLGVGPPEPPAGLRVVPRAAGHELEVRPACIAGADCEDPTPVEGYQIEILHCDSGARHPITREVGCSGLQLQRAQIGQLAPGKHQFAVSAFNYAGASPSISIVVDTALLPPPSAAAPAAPPSAPPPSAPPPSAPPPAPAAPQAPPAPQSPAGPLGGAEALLAAGASRPPPSAPADAQATAGGYPGPVTSIDGGAGGGGGGHGQLETPQRPVQAVRPQPQIQPGLSRAAAPSQNWPPGRSVRQLRVGQQQAAQPLRGWGDHPGQSPPAAASSVLAGALSVAPGAGPERALQQAARGLRPDVSAGYAAPRLANLGSGLPPQPSSQPPAQADLPFPAEPSQPRRALRPEGRGGGGGSEAHELRGSRPTAPPGARMPHYLLRQPGRGGAEQGLAEPHPRRRFAAAASPAPAAAAEETCDDEQLCVVCLAVPKSHAFVPCGHRCVCLTCGEGVLRQPKPSCPICRREASQILQIFT